MKLIKVPFSAGGLGKTDGCEEAPDKLAEKLKELCLTEDGLKAAFDTESIAVNNSNIEETNESIYNSMMQNDEVPVIVGGDHSITYACFKAFAKKFDNPGIVVFDAHPDCENDFSPPTHEDYLRVLVEENILKKENIVLVGIRSWHENELDFLRKNRIKHFTMKEISSEGLSDVCDTVMGIAKSFGALYISVDIDAIDPAFAPATGYIEPAGLGSREFIYFLQRLNKLKNVRAFDLVEINPKKDVNDMTVALGAKIIKEMFKY